VFHPIRRTAFTQFQNLLRGFLLDGSLPFNAVLRVTDIVDLIHQKLAETCDRILTLLVTLCTFLNQITATIPRAGRRAHASTPLGSPRGWCRVCHSPAEIAGRAKDFRDRCDNGCCN
jgi:hypothetical protein